MRIYISNQDVTDKIAANSVKWRRYAAFRSELSFRLEPFFTDGISVSHGMKAYMTDGYSQRVFAGEVTYVKEEYVNDLRSSFTVRCGGGETVLSRRYVGSFSTDAQTTGAAAKTLFLLYLSGASNEGFLYNPALFSNGAAINGYSVYSKSLAKVFDELASADGSRWWVLPDGTFYFTNRIDVTQSSFCVDLTGMSNNRLTDLSYFSTVKSTDGYRNVQYVAGANGIAGTAQNSAEITAMARHGGTGRYENAVFIPMISSVAEANAAAANILRSYDENSFNAVFTTETYGLKLFDRIDINAPQFGIYGLTPFVITEIAAYDTPTGDGNLAFSYTVKAKMSSQSVSYIRPPEYWTETLSRL